MTNKKIQAIVFREVGERLYDGRSLGYARDNNKLFDNDGCCQFLVLHTARGERAIWQGVTGSVEDGESTEAAARRELMEELALVPKRLVGPVHAFEFVREWTGIADDMVTEVCFGAEAPDDFEVRLSGEHDDFAWLNYEEARRRLSHENSRVTLDKLVNFLKR